MTISTNVLLTLPWPPSLNHYLEPTIRQSRSGKMYFGKKRTKKANKFREDVYWLVREQLGVGFAQFRFAVEVVITFHPPDRRKRDLDNFLKVLLDAVVNSGLLFDDSLVRRNVSVLADPTSGGKVVMRISPLHNDPSAPRG